ncbi:MAG: alkaline phosphatase family protein [Gemmatimonadaceae bacterium]
MIHAIRYPATILALVLAAHAGDIWRLAAGRAEREGRAATSEAQHVILVVADGLRWQEVFRGADSLLLFHSNATAGGRNAGAIRRRYWRSSVTERRAAVMPFVWSTIARQGQLYGNRDIGSAARVTNPMKFSYPGYNELLTGIPDPRIDRNDFGPNPNVTVFEWLDGREEFRGRVAVAGTWNTFRDIFNVSRSGLRVQVPGSDAGTHEAALRLLARKPRALFVGYGETDDYAHKGRYDLTLDAAHAVDRYVADLWSRVQAMPGYRGRTTLILVADHGRGRTTRDWKDHGADIAGSDETWFAVLGPGIAPLGARRDAAPVALAQTAASVATAVGLDYLRDVPRAAPPLPAITEGSAARRRVAAR